MSTLQNGLACWPAWRLGPHDVAQRSCSLVMRRHVEQFEIGRIVAKSAEMYEHVLFSTEAVPEEAQRRSIQLRILRSHRKSDMYMCLSAMTRPTCMSWTPWCTSKWACRRLGEYSNCPGKLGNNAMASTAGGTARDHSLCCYETLRWRRVWCALQQETLLHRSCTDFC